jgi:ring-1,2-phenylacetyl-CoA epoxidase subunit PaaC
MSAFETPEQLTGDLRAAAIDLLYRLGDDDLLIGHRMSEWTGLGPILEEDIAFSSMAQNAIGHALAYYRLLHELGEPAPDTLAFLRDAGQFRCAQLVTLEKGDWAFSLVRAYLYDTAKNVRLQALAQSAYQPLAILARKFIGEMKYHLMHGHSWIGHLGRAGEESRGKLRAGFETALPLALGLFEPTEVDATLAEAGIAPTEADLQQHWLDQIMPELEQAQLYSGKLPEPRYGGRRGQHLDALTAGLADLQKVYRLDPAAAW